MSSESINQTPEELKTAVSELTRNISPLAVAQTTSTVLHTLQSIVEELKLIELNSIIFKMFVMNR